MTDPDARPTADPHTRTTSPIRRSSPGCQRLDVSTGSNQSVPTPRVRRSVRALRRTAASLSTEGSQATYGYKFPDLSTEAAGEVQAIFNHQPFPDGTEPTDIRTRDEIANERYGHDFDDVSRETTIEVQNDYDAQFDLDN